MNNGFDAIANPVSTQEINKYFNSIIEEISIDIRRSIEKSICMNHLSASATLLQLSVKIERVSQYTRYLQFPTSTFICSNNKYHDDVA